MNIALTIPDSALPAWERRLAQYNAGSNAAPITLAGLLQLELDEQTARYETAHAQALHDLMRGVADDIIAAAKGDPLKLKEAIKVGKDAAIQFIQA